MQVNNNTDDLKMTGNTAEYADENDVKEAMTMSNSNDFHPCRWILSQEQRLNS